MSTRRALAGLVGLTLLTGGCASKLVRLAKQEAWDELDAHARAQKRTPRAAGARAWAQALVALDRSEEARALLLRDFRSGGQERSLLALAQLEQSLGLRGIAAVHYSRLAYLDPDTLERSEHKSDACELLRGRARAEAALGEAVAADADLRTLARVCADQIGEEDRALLSSLRPQAQAQVEAQRAMEAIEVGAGASAARSEELATQLELARKRGPRALAALADAMHMRVEPDDVAVLLAAELGGGLGSGLVSSSRLSAWIGDSEMQAVYAAVDTLPDGVREYALLRLASVRANPEVDTLRQSWIVAAGAALLGQGAHEAAKGWRISASVGQLSAAEFALNTNLRDMLLVLPLEAEEGDAEDDGDGGAGAPGDGEGAVGAAALHWSLRVPVERRSFDLLLALARLFSERRQVVEALELRRAVLVAGYDAGLAQVGEAAVEEVRRQLILGHPWQALAIAEVVPGPLLDEAFPTIVSALALARAAGLDEALAADENVVWRSLGEAWVEGWRVRLDAARSGLTLAEGGQCPDIGRWLADEAQTELAEVGLDPQRSRAALEASFGTLGDAGSDALGEPSTGAALVAAIESDLALTCSAPLVRLLDAGLHELALESLDERLVLAPGLQGAGQLQLHAELALAHGQGERATLLSLAAAATSARPVAMWTRAAVAGLDYGAREYTIEALRQVLLHSSEGPVSEDARRELLLMRLRDVDGDGQVRAGQALALAELRAQLSTYLDGVPSLQRWARLDALLWVLASEARADAEAWTRLLEVLDPAGLAASHPRAVTALLAAAAAASVDPGLAITPPESSPPPRLSDSRALCEAVSTEASGSDSGSDSGSSAVLAARVGAALACDERARAALLARLLADAQGEQREALRAVILAGPSALKVDAERPAIAETVPALAHEGLTLRVVYGLELGPAWAVGATPS